VKLFGGDGPNGVQAGVFLNYHSWGGEAARGVRRQIVGNS
jgi:hypothetical protein